MTLPTQYYVNVIISRLQVRLVIVRKCMQLFTSINYACPFFLMRVWCRTNEDEGQVNMHARSPQPRRDGWKEYAVLY